MFVSTHSPLQDLRPTRNCGYYEALNTALVACSSPGWAPWRSSLGQATCLSLSNIIWHRWSLWLGK